MKEIFIKNCEPDIYSQELYIEMVILFKCKPQYEVHTLYQLFIILINN